MSQVQTGAGEQQIAIQWAAKQYHVPAAILTGVYAIETDSGRNIATSSAGAMGAFQFIPTTAAQYHYPMTNNVDSTTFTLQAQAAAHYLSDLFSRTRSWDAALKSYSGGGYGLAQVHAKSGAAPPNNEIQGPIKAASDAVSAVPDAITGVFNQVVTDAKYAAVLVVAIVLGAALMLHGLRGGGGGSAGQRPMVVPV